tara:strand:+ start:122 stop:715 length:594 start_codon:yes stop_codon:yes gene_type:complete
MLKKILSLVSNSDFFGIYDNALTKKECQILINQFENSPKREGRSYSDGDLVVNEDQKKCIEVDNSSFSNKSVISRIINARLRECIDDYKKEYPSMDNFIAPWVIDNGYNVQKYETEEDGFKAWHTEAGGAPTSNRVLAWMFYLNDAKSGTEFINYPTVNAKMGRCVIWPAAWTHIHRGVVPNKGLKYIVTGWASYVE